MQKKRRILLVGNTAWSMYNFRKDLMLFLKDKGFDVEVAAPFDECAEKIEKCGIEFHKLKMLKAKGTNPLNEILFYRELYSLYKSVKPDIIFHYTIKPNIYGSMAARTLNIPAIAITTGLGHVFSAKGIVAGSAKILYRNNLRKAKEVWFLNNEDLQTFVKRKIIKKEKSFLLPGEGINTSNFTPTQLLNGDRKFQFLLSGRMIYDKGVSEFVEASRILKAKGYEFESLLLGFVDVQNPAAISLKQIQEWQAAGVIKYLGVTDNVIPILGASDCFVLPSFYREGIPRALLEASSMEKPIITSDNVGCREVIDDRVTGYLCRIKDPEDLAEKMEKIIKMPLAERTLMGQKGREKITNQFDNKIIFNIYLTKINEYFNCQDKQE